MRIGVIADEMTRCVNTANDVGPLADVAANHEKSRADFVAAEHVEECVCGGIVRTVVVRKGDLIWVVAGNEGASEELRAGIERGASESADGCDGRKASQRELFGDARIEHDYFLSWDFLRRARTSSAWPSGFTLLNS